MQRLKENGHYIAATLGVGGILAAGLMSGSGPLFDSPDSFVLLAKDQITMGSDLALSSGDLGVNNPKGRITVGSKGSINGDLFADTVILGANNSVNGSATAKRLTKGSGTEILGEASTAFSSPLVSPFPTVPNFTPGNQNLTLRLNSAHTIQPGSYRTIASGSNTTLTFPGGIYNIDRLSIGSNTILHFQAPTILNVRSTATFGSKTIFSPASSLQLEDIKLNIKGSNVAFGSNGFISGVITAPDANVTLGSNATFRGQIVGRRIIIGSNLVLSRNARFEKESNLEKVATVDGAKIIVNEIVVIQSPQGTLADLLRIAEIVGGVVTGYIPDMGMGKIEVVAVTLSELDAEIAEIENSNDPTVEGVSYNVLTI